MNEQYNQLSKRPGALENFSESAAYLNYFIFITHHVKSESEEEFIREFIEAVYTNDANRQEETFDQFVNWILRLHKHRNLVDRDDITQAFVDLVIFAHEGKVTKEELAAYLRKELFTEKDFEFYFPIYGTRGFPDNFRIGKCVARTFGSLPEQVKEKFNEIWEMDWKLSGGKISSLDESLVNNQQSLILATEVRSIGQWAAAHKSGVIIDESLDVLRLIYGLHLQPSDYCYSIRPSGEVVHQLPIEKIISESEVVEYDDKNDNVMSFVNGIMTKEGKLTELEEKIINTIHLIGVATSSPYNDIRFVIMCSALEAMLLSKGDKDYLGWKLAERAAFLTASKEERSEVVRNITKLYNKRSGFVHQDRDEKITHEDYTVLVDIVYEILASLLRLRERGYERVSKAGNDQKSISDLVDKMKYLGLDITNI